MYQTFNLLSLCHHPSTPKPNMFITSQFRQDSSYRHRRLQGYTPELIEELYKASQQTGDFQMKYLLEKLLEKNEVDVADVVSRVNFLITGLFVRLLWLFCLVFPLSWKNLLTHRQYPSGELIWIIFLGREGRRQTRSMKKCVHHSLTTNKKDGAGGRGKRRSKTWKLKICLIVRLFSHGED